MFSVTDPSAEPQLKLPKLAMISTLNRSGVEISAKKRTQTNNEDSLNPRISQNTQNTLDSKNNPANSPESTNIPSTSLHADVLCIEPDFITSILAERKLQENLKLKNTQKLPNKRKRASITRKNTSLQIVPFNLEPIDTSLLQRYASLPTEILRERVLQLYDIAHQLSVQEEHEIAKGRYLEILKR